MAWLDWTFEWKVSPKGRAQIPLGLNETLLAMRAYASYHYLCAVTMRFAIANNQAERVPHPDACFLKPIRLGWLTTW